MLRSNRYMKKNKVSLELAMKIQNYIEYFVYKERITKSQEEQSMIDLLPKNLKDELVLESYGHHIKNIPLLTKNFSDDFLKKLVSRHGRIVGRRKTGCSAVSQRAVTEAIKRARFMALLPYVGD